MSSKKRKAKTLSNSAPDLRGESVDAIKPGQLLLLTIIDDHGSAHGAAPLPRTEFIEVVSLGNHSLTVKRLYHTNPVEINLEVGHNVEVSHEIAARTIELEVGPNDEVSHESRRSFLEGHVKRRSAVRRSSPR